jgi:adenylosuccinate lyase
MSLTRQRFAAARFLSNFIKKIDNLLEVLKRRAFEFKHTPQIGRTHGIHAEPTSFGMTWALWYAEMQRNGERLQKPKNHSGRQN